jgi:hypothetical protein
MHIQPSVIRAGLWILPVSGIIWIVGSPLRGDLPDPNSSAVAFAAAISAPSFLWGVCVNLVGLFLATFGFMALYAYLTESNPSKLALGGMVLTVLGQEMTLSFYGIFLLVLPRLGQIHALGSMQADVSVAVLTNPGFVALYIVSGLAYVAGSILFSVVMVRRASHPKWVAVCFSLSGFVLCAAPVFQVPVPISNVLGAVLLIASSGWIAWTTK